MLLGKGAIQVALIDLESNSESYFSFKFGIENITFSLNGKVCDQRIFVYALL